VPVGQLPLEELAAEMDNLDWLVTVSAAAPDTSALETGDAYYGTGDDLIYTWDGSEWDGGAKPERHKIYIVAADNRGYIYTGSALVPLDQVTGGGAAGVTVLEFDDTGWAQDEGDSTVKVKEIVLDEGEAPYAVLSTEDPAGHRTLLDTQVVSSGGAAVLTLRDFAPSSGRVILGIAQ
jgi:hypothetical protein